MPLPFADAHQPQHPIYYGSIEAGSDDLGAGLFLIDMPQQDGIEDVIRLSLIHI